MAKPRTPNQRKIYEDLGKRLQGYNAKVMKIYEGIALEAARMVSLTSYGMDEKKPFRFKDYPKTKAGIDKLMKSFVANMQALIYSGISEEWKNSNLIQDLLVNKVLAAYDAQVHGEKYKMYYRTNSEAEKAFKKRAENGLTISDKLWTQSKLLREELEDTISVAIRKGTSAITLSKRVSKYLQDFDKFQKDYKDLYGKASTVYDCEYRSIRLAASEINMAYRTAENERWQQMDFVVGYEIKPSQTAKREPDICDILAGKYPKDFVWSGWHPLCKDFKVAIMKTKEEWASGSDESVNEVKDVPDAFKQYIGTNAYRIQKARAKGTEPYFIRDNKELIDRILTDKPKKDVYLPKDVSDASIWEQNTTETEKKLGITKAKEMTFDEANELKGNVNYGKGRQYSINCQSCVVANELRRRGFDVTAHGNYEKGDMPQKLSYQTNMAWIDPDTNQMPIKKRAGGIYFEGWRQKTKTYTAMMKEFDELTKEVGRYHIDCGWKRQRSGHIITAERKEDGTIVVYDPQNGKKIDNFRSYAKNFSLTHGIGIVKVDKMLINTDIIDGVVHK